MPARQRLTYESWREGLDVAYGVNEEFAEAAVLDQLRAPASALRGVSLVLGEPGAGKSRLLAEWHRRWLDALWPLHLGARVPMLVRLRDVTSDDLSLAGDALADRLAERFAIPALAAAVKGGVSAALAALPPRLLTPVWLLDGLDEAARGPADAGLWERLASLPGDVIVTCRTAVFEAARREVAGRVAREWRILGLKPHEQPAFLAKALEAEGQDASRAAALVNALNGNRALRPLAAVPLLLRLVAEAPDRLVLPHNRAGFYAAATNALWARRLGDEPAFDLAVARDEALTALARAMGLARLEADAAMLQQAGIVGELRAALHRSGLLRFGRRLTVSFPHLTFQEYFLARSWLAEDFTTVLDAHWANARYQEALGLLMALHWEAGRGAETEAALAGFVTSWHERPLSAPIGIWDSGGAGHLGLALLARAGVTAADPLLGAGAAPRSVRLHIAARRNITPSGMAGLAVLARDQDKKVRREVALNAATPPDTLNSLACDQDEAVRWIVARNAATPPDMLSTLARDPDKEVRQGIARNAATPPNALNALACDPDKGVRWGVALNAAAPADTLNALARDTDKEVRWGVALNAATPVDTLNALARDTDNDVRRWVARNAATPADTLNALARDPDKEVRQGVAQNPATPAGTLSTLAFDTGKEVRCAIAFNAAMPADALNALARDTDNEVRGWVARNAATPADTLNALARDTDNEVRRWVARNAATPADTVKAITSGWVVLHASTRQDRWYAPWGLTRALNALWRCARRAV